MCVETHLRASAAAVVCGFVHVLCGFAALRELAMCATVSLCADSVLGPHNWISCSNCGSREAMGRFCSSCGRRIGFYVSKRKADADAAKAAAEESEEED